MSTVKSMAGEDIVSSAYDERLQKYLHLQTKESGAYSLYASLTIFCPNAAMLATLAYGVSLSLDGKIRGDDLYSFILYQQTLGSAFQYLGDIYSGISAALGAADKVRDPFLPPVQCHARVRSRLTCGSPSSLSLPLSLVASW